MSKIILVTGGSRSGKSTFAEKLLEDKDDVIYIATAIAADGEMKKRIEKHRERRNAKWVTFEGYKDLCRVLKEFNNEYIMLECMGTMLTNFMFDKEYDYENISSEDIDNLSNDIKEEMESFIKGVRENNRDLIIVTNEVGWSLVPEYKLGRVFSDILGDLNQFLGSLSDKIYLVACGFPVKLK